jgi:hypothetical protein
VDSYFTCVPVLNIIYPLVIYYHFICIRCSKVLMRLTRSSIYYSTIH